MENVLTSQQRAYLTSSSDKPESIFQIGKCGINENQLKQIDEVNKCNPVWKLYYKKYGGCNDRFIKNT